MSAAATAGPQASAAVTHPPPAADAFAAIVAARRSVYGYTAQPVPHEALERAVHLALQAPNHHRTRPLRLFAFSGEGREALALAYEAAAVRLGRDTRQARARATEAPVMVVAACLPQLANPRVTVPEEEFAAAAAIQTMLLALASEGLSSVITTGELPEAPEVHGLVGLRPGEGRVVCVVDVGYANPERRLPPRVVPDVASCLHWRTRQ